MCRRTFGITGKGNNASEEWSTGAGSIGGSGWWSVEPGMGRVAHGISARLDRLKGLGNAQVPLCAAVAWKTLYEKINEK